MTYFLFHNHILVTFWFLSGAVNLSGYVKYTCAPCTEMLIFGGTCFSFFFAFYGLKKWHSEVWGMYGKQQHINTLLHELYDSLWREGGPTWFPSCYKSYFWHHSLTALLKHIKHDQDHRTRQKCFRLRSL